MKEFETGDKVVCDGIQGVVTLVNLDNHPYPVHVGFDDGVCDNFTIEGKSFTSDKHPSLFHVDDSEAASVKKKEFKVDDRVICDGVEGVVTSTNDDKTPIYPVRVEFYKGEIETYTPIVTGKQIGRAHV